uniref:Uncharacterized protein n=1 Tax=Rhizophora mucronata TaxID=61149 RepID=A0A2P2NSJ5_RHIMU
MCFTYLFVDLFLCYCFHMILFILVILFCFILCYLMHR